MEKEKASLLLFVLGMALNGMPHLYVEDRWPSFPNKKKAVGRKGIWL